MHLKQLLALSDFKGGDVRLDTSDGAPLSHQGIPYPAFIWQWEALQCYAWKQHQHIHILEFVALFNYIRSLCPLVLSYGKMQIHILDSLVVTCVVARGRSSSRRLNRVARRFSAFLLALDCYVHPAWTISRWMGCDQASRVHEGPEESRVQKAASW